MIVPSPHCYYELNFENNTDSQCYCAILEN